MARNHMNFSPPQFEKAPGPVLEMVASRSFGTPMELARSRPPRMWGCFVGLALAAWLLSACGGGAVFIGDGVSATLNVPPASGNGTEVLSVVVQEPAGRNCARGGSRVDSGVDLNRNQVLDFSEINTTRYVCNA